MVVENPPVAAPVPKSYAGLICIPAFERSMAGMRDRLPWRIRRDRGDPDGTKRGSGASSAAAETADGAPQQRITTRRRNRTLGMVLACVAVLMVVAVMTLAVLLHDAEARHAFGLL
jgi:hypothetical protein